jgi:LacI family transcriptional regulator
LHVVQSIQKLGRRIPEEVQIIGFDNIELSRIIVPRLSTIAQSSDQIGRYAVETLLKMIEGKPIEKTHEQIDVKLIERETTK